MKKIIAILALVSISSSVSMAAGPATLKCALDVLIYDLSGEAGIEIRNLNTEKYETSVEAFKNLVGPVFMTADSDKENISIRTSLEQSEGNLRIRIADEILESKGLPSMTGGAFIALAADQKITLVGDSDITDKEGDKSPNRLEYTLTCEVKK